MFASAYARATAGQVAKCSEPGPLRLAPKTVRLPDFEDNRSTSAHRKLVRKPGFAPGPSPSQGEMLLLHHDPDPKAERGIRNAERGAATACGSFCIPISAPRIKLGPLVGLAPTNTSLRNSPCCFWRHRGFENGALTWICTTNLRLRKAACRTDYTLGALEWRPWPDAHRLVPA